MGAQWVDGKTGWIYQAGGYRAQGDWGRPVLSMSRPLLESVVRRRVELLDDVRVEDGRHSSSGSTSSTGASTGVVVDGILRAADLVVDCSGRSSRLAHQLESAGSLAPPMARVTIDCAYTSGFLRVRQLTGKAASSSAAPRRPTSYRAGAVLPVEGDRWMVTLAGVHSEVPGTSDEEVLAFAHSLSSPAVAQLIEALGPLSSVASYRFPSSQRRHYEKAPRLLQGSSLSATPRAVSTPIYGQGMACAALQAAALGDAVRELGVGSEELPRRFHREAASIIDSPWAIAVGADFLHPKTVGPKARGTDLGQPIRVARYQGHPHLRRIGEVVQPRAQPGRVAQLTDAAFGRGSGAGVVAGRTSPEAPGPSSSGQAAWFGLVAAALTPVAPPTQSPYVQAWGRWALVSPQFATASTERRHGLAGWSSTV